MSVVYLPLTVPTQMTTGISSNCIDRNNSLAVPRRIICLYLVMLPYRACRCSRAIRKNIVLSTSLIMCFISILKTMNIDKKYFMAIIF